MKLNNRVKMDMKTGNIIWFAMKGKAPLTPALSFSATKLRYPVVGLLSEVEESRRKSKHPVAERLLEIISLTFCFCQPKIRNFSANYRNVMNLHLVCDEEFIRELTRIVLDNLEDEKFGVEELILQSKLSPSILRRRLKSAAQKKINQFISEIRLQKAYELLKNSRLTVSEVASSTGFNSPAYFTACFHNHFGYPPVEVKRRSVEKGESTPETDSAGTSELPEDENSLPGKKSMLKFFITASSFIVLAGIIIYAGYRAFPGNFPEFSSRKNPEKSIAVLPFKNLSEERENQHFADGVMEEILNNLSRIENFRVISRTSTERFRDNQERSAREIAGELRADYLVEGTVQKYGDKIRLRVQLIRPGRRETHLLGESYEREIKGTNDIFLLQSQIAQEIASALKTTITPEEKQLIEKAPTISLLAYDLYLRGKEEHLKYKLDNNKREALGKAEEFYLQALENDSTYAQVYAGLAAIYWDKHFYKDYLKKNFMDSVLILSDKALSFDLRLSDAYYLRGAYFSENGDYKTAEAEFVKAIKLNPSNWLAYYGRGILFVSEDDLLKAIENLETAASLNYGPESPLILYRLGILYAMAGFVEKAFNIAYEWLRLTGDSARAFMAMGEMEFNRGNYRKSIEYYEKCEMKDSADYALLWPITYPYIWNGHFREALKFTQEYTKLFDLNYSYYFNKLLRIGYIFWANGFEKEAGYYFDKQIETCNKAIESKRTYANNKYAYYDLAAVYAFRGDKENAYKNLRIYNERKFFTYGFIHYIKTDPLFNNLKEDAEFRQIVKEQEVKYRSGHEKVRKWMEAKGLL